MKALSIHQPWAWAILHAGKTIENRTWKTSYRGPLAIHASRSKNSYLREKAFDWKRLYGVVLPEWDELITGAIVGVVDLVGCVRSEWTLPEQVTVPGIGPSQWAQPNSWCWILENARPITPIPYSGKQLLFDAPMVMS